MECLPVYIEVAYNLAEQREISSWTKATLEYISKKICTFLHLNCKMVFHFTKSRSVAFLLRFRSLLGGRRRKTSGQRTLCSGNP